MTDGNGGASQVPLTINLNDINDAPQFAQVAYTGSVDEEQATGAAVTLGVALVATDADGDVLTYSLIGKW